MKLLGEGFLHLRIFINEFDETEMEELSGSERDSKRKYTHKEQKQRNALILQKKRNEKEQKTYRHATTCATSR